MSNRATRKELTILLILSLFLSLFLGGYHHGCDYYSQTCSTCQQASHQPILLTAATAADHIQPLPVASFIVLPTEIFPPSALASAPISGRAPPCSS
jgi:hypothetical protein